MTLPPDPGSEPIDYWRAVTRRGVLALGFRVQRSPEGPVLVAEPVGPLEGWTKRAAMAAIAVHEDVQATRDLALIASHAVLLLALERSAAVLALSAYQDLLAAAIWRTVSANPARGLEALGRGLNR
ncbi:hypothetical protein [Caulobacter flavus]|jgi:hypothetical protein|nr:hypothetical protein [Caulobacter flavus]